MRTMRFAPLAAIGCVALLALVGCRDRSSVQDDQDKLCVEVAEVDRSVTELAAVEPNAGGAARIREIRTRLEAQWREVEEASKEVGSFRIDAVRQAYNNVLASINGVNDEGTLRQAEPRIDAAAGEFSTARLDMHNTAGCS